MHIYAHTLLYLYILIPKDINIRVYKDLHIHIPQYRNTQE